MAFLYCCASYTVYDQCSATGSLTVFVELLGLAEKQKTAAEKKQHN